MILQFTKLQKTIQIFLSDYYAYLAFINIEEDHKSYH